MARFYRHLVLFAAMAFSLAVVASAATAPGTPESGPIYAGHVTIDLATGLSRFTPAPTVQDVVGDVYANTTTPLFGYSTTDLAAILGDRVTTTGAGVLDQNDFSVFNSSASAGPLLTAQFLLSFYDAPTVTPLGAYLTSTVTFGGGAGLPAGYYTIVSVTGLSALNIGLPTDVLITQQIYAYTGTTTRMGIVSFDPPTIGSSPAYMYVSSTTLPAGYYNLSSGNANPGYRINVINVVPTRNTTWGQLKQLYR